MMDSASQDYEFTPSPGDNENDLHNAPDSPGYIPPSNIKVIQYIYIYSIAAPVHMLTEWLLANQEVNTLLCIVYGYGLILGRYRLCVL